MMRDDVPRTRVHHVDGSIDPVRDIEVVNTELLLADISALEKRAEKNARKVKGGDRDATAENAIIDAFKLFGSHGVTVSYESAATFAALRKLRAEGVIPVGARVLLLLTATHFVSLAQQIGKD